MLPDLPPTSAFAAHGLYNVQLDLPAVASSPNTQGRSLPSSQSEAPEWLAGWASLEPAPRFPLLATPKTDEVKWALCGHVDPASATRFRRYIVCLALDSMDPEDTLKPRFSPAERCIAWWEDEYGLWTIREAVRSKHVPLAQRWASIVGDSDVENENDIQLDIGTAQSFPIGQQQVGQGQDRLATCAQMCELLLQVISCLQALHYHRLALLACRPSSFLIHPSSGKAHLIRYSEVTILPGFTLANVDPSLSPLFERNPLESASLQLSEDFIRKNLRYLAPEIIGSRRSSPNSDIYSFGVMAYERLTGTNVDGGPDQLDNENVDLLADFHRHVTMQIVSPLVVLKRQKEFGTLGTEVPPKPYSDIIMRCLEKDPEERYGSLDALSYDLRQLWEVCRAGGDPEQLVIGEVDKLARFQLPSRPANREQELQQLGEIFELVTKSTEAPHGKNTAPSATQTVTLWGLSGAGKTRLVSHWIRQWEEAKDCRQRCLVAYAKLDEHIRRPLSSFVQIFESLLDRVLTDPDEDPQEWNRSIRDVLGSQLSFFSSLLSNESRRLLHLENDSRYAQETDWEKLPAFKMWGKRLLQLFATRGRPLIMIVDDIQWLPQEEIETWNSLSDENNPLTCALIVSLYRVDSIQAPSSSLLLSASSALIYIPRFDEEGVLNFINQCLHSRVDDGDTLANLLFAETDGSPLYLRTVLANLVKEQVVHFDFDVLSWRFNLSTLQSHLSDAGMDVYIERLLRGLPEDVKRFLTVLACLPATGFFFDGAAQLVDVTRTDIEAHLHESHVIGTLVIIQGQMIKFAHDRLRHGAYLLIPTDKLGETHRKISEFLRRFERSEDYVFDAAEHAILAKAMNVPHDDEDFVSLLLTASRRAAGAASFDSSRRFLSEIDQVIGGTGGSKTWSERHRAFYTRFLAQFSETYSILKQHDEVIAKLHDMAPLCISAAERIRLATWLMRALIAAGRHIEAMDLVWRTLRNEGFDPESPETVTIWTPTSVEEIEALHFSEEPVDEDDERVLMMSLLSYAGPTIFVTRPNDRAAAFALGFTLAAKVGKVHDAVAYLSGTYAITNTGLALRRALCHLARRICLLRPNSLIASAALVVIGAQAHCFLPLHEVSEDMKPAFDATISSCNYELASYVLVLDFAARAFSSIPQNWDVVARRYEVLRPYVSTDMKILIHIPLQSSENRRSYSPGTKTWELEGQFISREDIEKISALKMHLAFWHTFALRQAIIFDAPLEEQLALMRQGAKVAAASEGTVVGIEWAFLCTIVCIRSKEDVSELEDAEKKLEEYHALPDYAARIDFIAALKSLMTAGIEDLIPVEQAIDRLNESKQLPLSGLLNSLVGDAIFRRTKSKRIAAGFLREAFRAHQNSGSVGVCQWLKTRYPDVLPKAPTADFLPSQLLKLDVSSMVTSLRPGHPSLSNETTSSLTPSVIPEEKQSFPTETLDTLTLMRSSVVLASEQDPPVLLCTLLRILCQFTHSDYAAIGLSDENDHTAIRLRAAGPYGTIVPYDLGSNDPIFQSTCPAVYMLHVARTGKAIIDVSSLDRRRSDQFYGDRQPRSLICLPIANQGQQAGVVLLSSMSTVSSHAQSASAREVIGCLATFATVVMTNYSFTRRLKLEVAQRTKELTAALAAKSQFLSQCSHELRSPLSAVLGFSAVLQASPGLNDVQLEHLHMITRSGEDLLGLINNILDHSRLDSGAVTLERIPFTLREVTEGVLDTVAVLAQQKDLEMYLLNSYKTDPPGLLGDPFRVRQVITNLCVNAVKFTTKGRVTLLWKWEESDSDRIKIILEVEDTGIGIQESKMVKLFQSFSQVDESITRSFGGSGLGLVISRDLARVLGGDCFAESEFGKGSKFTFSFVAERNHEFEQHYETLQKEQSCFILCDEGPLWTILEENLQALNCKPVRFAEDAQRALVQDVPYGLNSKLDYDLVVLSTQLLDKETLQKMRQLQKTAEFIFLVRSIDLGNEMSKFDIDRDSIVARPVKFSSLYNAIRNRVVSEERPDTSKATSKKKKPNHNKGLYKTHPLEILVVDDNSVNISVARRVLELFGYRDIPSASNGQEAIDAAEEKVYDLILLDLQMPVVDGFTAQKAITASPNSGDPCIVAVTANADKETQAACEEAGFYNYLTKPLDIPKLEMIVMDVYEYRSKNHMVVAESASREENQPSKGEDSTVEHQAQPSYPGIDSAPEGTDSAVEHYSLPTTVDKASAIEDGSGPSKVAEDALVESGTPEVEIRPQGSE